MNMPKNARNFLKFRVGMIKTLRIAKKLAVYREYNRLTIT